MSTLLNPAADYEGAARLYREQRRTSLTDFLRPDFADALRAELLAHEDWNLVFRDNERHYDLAPAQWRALTPEMERQLRERIIAVGQLGFQYNYYTVPLYDMVEAGRRLPPRLQQLYDLLQSDAFIGAMRGVTGAGAITFADCQATRFCEGHFLNTHDDEIAGKNRHAAYVLSLNPHWQPDWGGMLGFPAAGEAQGAYISPRHNCLNLFAVPQPHYVGMVTPLAESPRLSITGWLRS